MQTEYVSQQSSRRPYAPRLPGHERREQLLDAALRLITRKGYDTITIAAISREAGVTRPVVYSQFDTLPQLLDDLLEREAQRALTQIAEAMPIDPGDRTPAQVTLNALDAFLEAVQERPDTWRAILLPPLSTPSTVRKRMEWARAQVEQRLQGIIAWGLKRQGMGSDADTELLTMTLLGLFEQAGRLLLNDPERYPPERIASFAESLLIDSGLPS